MECIPTSIRVKILIPLAEHIHTFGTVITATNLPKQRTSSLQNVYGKRYFARGNMENRIREQ